MLYFKPLFARKRLVSLQFKTLFKILHFADSARQQVFFNLQISCSAVGYISVGRLYSPIVCCCVISGLHCYFDCHFSSILHISNFPRGLRFEEDFVADSLQHLVTLNSTSILQQRTRSRSK